MSDKANKLSRGLSIKQKELLYGWWGKGNYYDGYITEQGFNEERSAKALLRKGVVSQAYPYGQYWITDLGKAVIEELKPTFDRWRTGDYP